MTVKQAQWQLLLLDYYDGAIDGIWGPKSKAATLQFQKEFFEDDIAHDSLFGASTAAKTQEIVDRIQDILQTVVPELVDDGLAGPRTMAALQRYQEARGLPQTGRVDDDTWDALVLEIPKVEQPQEPVPEQDTDGADTDAGDKTGTFWDGIVYFSRNEMRCKCGGRHCNGFPAEPQELLMNLADRARDYFGRPAHVISGLRCSRWNQIQGGVANSQHMYGEAMDIYIEGVTADRLLAWMQKQPEVRYCYKINSTNVHFDIPKGKR